MNHLYWKEKYDKSNKIGTVAMVLLFAVCVTIARPEMVKLNAVLIGMYIVTAHVHMLYRCSLVFRQAEEGEALLAFCLGIAGVILAPLIAPLFIGDYKGDRI